MATEVMSLVGSGLGPQYMEAEVKRKSVKTMIMKKSSRTCPICIEGFKEEEIIKKLPCKHIFHRSCLKQWFKKSNDCPLCRKDHTDSGSEQK